MIDGLLFILILINFAITLTLFLRYNRSQEEDRVQEIRKEMTDMLVRFNKDAERNIRIIEDRIQKSKDLFSRQEIMLKAMETNMEKREKKSEEKQVDKFDNRQLNHKKLNISKEEAKTSQEQNIESKPEKTITKPFQFEDFNLEKEDDDLKEKINFKQFIEKYSKTADNPLIIKSKPDNEKEEQKVTDNTLDKDFKFQATDVQPVKKSFIQKAYQTAPKKVVEPENQAEKNLEESKQRQVETGLKSKEEELAVSEVEMTRKEKIRKIARLIGEGKSFEEISEIMNMSMTEIDLFKSLIKNKLVK